MGQGMRNDRWPEILDDYIRENKAQVYKYGKADCIMFMAGFVKQITGKDVLKGKRYKGEKSALRLLKEFDGLFNLVNIQFEKVGFEPVEVMRARRGDVVGFETAAHGETVGICVGNMFVSQGIEDLVFLPMSTALRAWRVN